MGTEILSSEATLKTLSVTIQSLVVSGKQVTLAVFRQFPEGSLIAENGAMRSCVPWGYVRYGAESERFREKPDLWVVAEADGHLFKCAIKYELNGLRTLINWIPESVLEYSRQVAEYNSSVKNHEEHIRECEANGEESWLNENTIQREVDELRKAKDDISEAKQILDADRSMQPTRRETVKHLERLIDDLPQLFIAV